MALIQFRLKFLLFILLIVIFEFVFADPKNQTISNFFRKDFYNWKILSEFIENYEEEFKKMNIKILKKKLETIKIMNNETNLSIAIDFYLNSIYEIDEIFEFEKNIHENLKLNSNSTVDDEIDIQYNNIIQKFLLKSSNGFFFLKNGDYKTNELERKLQFNPSGTNINAIQNFNTQNNQLNSNLQSGLVYNRAYLNNLGQTNHVNNQAVYSQGLTNLLGKLSITNPAFRMIISTVFMCLGSTPYGAIAILVVVTVYTLIEIVVKYFYNRSKNKNIINSIKKSALLEKLSNKQYFGENAEVKNNLDNQPIRNLKKNTAKEFKFKYINQLLINSFIENQNENEMTENKLNILIEHLNIVSMKGNQLGYEKKSFLDENFAEKLFGILADIATKLVVENEYSNSKNFFEKTSFKNNSEFKIETYFYEQLSSLNNFIPNWYRKLYLISNYSKKTRAMQDTRYFEEDWLPVRTNNMNISNIFSYDSEFMRAEDILNFQTNKDDKNHLPVEDLNANKHIRNDIVSEMKSGLNEKNEKNINSLNQTKEGEVKWYDGIIKYSIQSYKQSGIRGVITMILDIFSTIFSATPIGYLIVTLIRLIAFMTDKLLLLSRRRTNQRQLRRLILELPSTFDQEKLILIIKEIKFIEDDCKKIVNLITKLFKNLFNHLLIFNPSTENKNSFVNYETNMLRILQNKVRTDGSKVNSSYKVGGLKNNTYTNPEIIDGMNSNQGWVLYEYKQSPENKQKTNLEKNKISDFQEQESIAITSKVIKETKTMETIADNRSKVKNSFQNMIGGLKSFLLNLFKSVFGAAGELWEYIKGILLRIIDFIKTLWEAIRGERNKRLLIELIQEMPSESVVHKEIFNDIINLFQK